MKQKHLISLLQDGYTTVKVTFAGSSQFCTYKTDLALAIGDQVVVPVKNGRFRVVTIASVDATPDIDVDSDREYLWVVQKVDTELHYSREAKEAAIRQKLLELERQTQRSLFLEKLKANLPSESATLLEAIIDEARQITNTTKEKN